MVFGLSVLLLVLSQIKKDTAPASYERRELMLPYYLVQLSGPYGDIHVGHFKVHELY